jgi:hypothetical protein
MSEQVPAGGESSANTPVAGQLERLSPLRGAITSVTTLLWSASLREA